MKYLITLLVVILLLTFTIKPTKSFQVESVSDVQALGPSSIAITENGQYAYVGFMGSENVIKVRLEDFTIDKVADLTEYFPIMTYYLLLDQSEEKLFVHTRARKKILVIDTNTMNVVHTIDDMGTGEMIQSHFGPFLIVWDPNILKTINTETYEVTDFTNPDISFLGIRESRHNEGLWYIITQNSNSDILGTYDNEAMVMVDTLVTFPIDVAISDYIILEDEQKAYLCAWGGFYPEGNHSYGWFYSIDLATEDVNIIDTDGAAYKLEMSPDQRRIYLSTDHPWPDDTNNILVFDTQSNMIVSQIHLPKYKGIWPYTEMRDLKLDPVNSDYLYVVAADADAFVKIDLNSQVIVEALYFWKTDLMPHFFVRGRNQSSGYVLIHKSAKSFVLDLDNATITNVVEFPLIRDDIYNYDIAINDAGRMYIAQGESILEVNIEDMQIVEIHPIPPGIGPFNSFVLSNDNSKIYTVWPGPTTGGYPPDTFLAIDVLTFQATANFRLEGGGFNSRPFELPDRSKLYVLGGQFFGSIVIHVIETENYTIQKTITFDEPDVLGISAGPYYPFAYDSSSHTLFVGATQVVLAIDTDTDIITKVIYMRDIASAIGLESDFIWVNPLGLVYQPDENYLYMSHLDRHFVSIYDLNTDQFLSQVIPLSGFSPSYAFANDDYSKIYVTNTMSDNISVIDVESKTEEKVIDLQAYLDTTLTSVQDKEEIPRKFTLIQNYPNPFNPSTKIQYTLPKNTFVKLIIYDVLGNVVETLVNKVQPLGTYTVNFIANNIASGIYFYQLKTDSKIFTRKMILMK